MSRPDELEIKAASLAAGAVGISTRAPRFELKSSFPLDDDPDGTAWAIVAVTGVQDDVGDIITPGAFTRTLTVRQVKGCLGHDWNRPVARAERVHELLPGDSRLPRTLADGTTPWPREAGALLVKARYNLGTRDGRDAWEHAKFYGAQHGYSIGYKVAKARNVKGVRHIDDLDLYEFSPVLHGANRLATLQAVKSAEPDMETTDLDGAEAKARYVRDADYWGRPLGTLILPGMKPRGRVATALRRKGKTPDANLGTADDESTAKRTGSSTGKASAAKVKEYEREIDESGLFPEPEATGRNRAERGARGGDGVDAAHNDLAESFRDGSALGRTEDDKAELRQAARTKLLKEGEQPDEVEERLRESLADDLDNEEYGEDLDTEIDDFVDDYRKASRDRGLAQDAAARGDDRAAPAAARGSGQSAAPQRPEPDPQASATTGDGDTGEAAGGMSPEERRRAANSLAQRIGVQSSPEKMKRVAEQANDDQLAALDEEMASRAEQLGKPGQVSGMHQVIKDIRAQRERDRADADAADAAARATDDVETFTDPDGNQVDAGGYRLDTDTGLSPEQDEFNAAANRAEDALTGGGDEQELAAALSDLGVEDPDQATSDILDSGAGARDRLRGIVADAERERFGRERGASTPAWRPGQDDAEAPETETPDAPDAADAPSVTNDDVIADYQRTNPIPEDEVAALESYKRGPGTVNAWLRGEKKLPDGRKITVSKAQKDEIAKLDAAADRYELPGNAVLYRGIGDKTFPTEALDGQVIEDGAFMSTSFDDGFAGPIQMEIHAPKGTKGIPVDGVGGGIDFGEQEFLLPRGTKLRVRSDSRDGNTRKIVADVVPADEPDTADVEIEGPDADAPNLPDGAPSGATPDLETPGDEPNPDAPELPDGLETPEGDTPAAGAVDWQSASAQGRNDALRAVGDDYELTVSVVPNEDDGDNVGDKDPSYAWTVRHTTPDGDVRVDQGEARSQDEAMAAAETRLDELRADPDSAPGDRDTPDPDGAELDDTSDLDSIEGTDEGDVLADGEGNTFGEGEGDGADGGEMAQVQQARDDAEAAHRAQDPQALADALRAMGMSDDDDPDGVAAQWMELPGEEVSRRLDRMEAERQADIDNGAPSGAGIDDPDGGLDADEARLSADDLDKARALENDALGLSEGDDGELEVSGDVADRQDRVEALLNAEDAPDLTSQSVEQVGATRRDLVEELRLQETIRRRDRERRDRDSGTDPAGGDTDRTGGESGAEGDGEGGGADPAPKPERTKPTQRPGLAGAADDLADAVESGDQARIDAALARARRSLARSNGESEQHTALAEMLDRIAGGDQVDAAELRELAAALREQARTRRNEQARNRRAAKRLERDRLRSLIGQYDAELRNRNRDPDEFGGAVPERGEPDQPGGEATPDGAVLGDEAAPDPGPGPDPEPQPDPAPTASPEVSELLGTVGGDPNLLLFSRGQFDDDELHSESARNALRPVYDKWAPVVQTRGSDSYELARKRAAKFPQGPGSMSREGIIFASLIPTDRRREFTDDMAQAVENYKAAVAAGNAGRNSDPAPRGSDADVPTLAASGSARQGRGGRLIALAPRPKAAGPAGSKRFDSVDAVVANLRDVRHPGEGSIPEWRQRSEDEARDALINNITTGKESYLSPGGGLLAYRDESTTPKRWKIIHTGTGLDITELGDPRIDGQFSYETLPLAGFDLDGPGMRGMLDSLERVTDARGRQIDWTDTDAARLRESMRAWQDYDPDGQFRARPASDGTGRGLISAATLDAVSTSAEPDRYASTRSFALAANGYRPNADQSVLDSGKIGGPRRSIETSDYLTYLLSDVNNGKKRRNASDDRTASERRDDVDTGRVVAMAQLRANSGQPAEAAELLRARAAELRAKGYDDGPRLGGPIPPNRLDSVADTIAANNVEGPGQVEQLSAGQAGDRLAIPSGTYSVDLPNGGRATGDQPTIVTLVTPMRQTGTDARGNPIYSATARTNGTSASVPIDDINDTFEIEISPDRGIRIDPNGGGRSSTLQFSGDWAFVPAGQPEPTTLAEANRLARRDVDRFNEENGLEPSGRGRRGDDDGGDGGGGSDDDTDPDGSDTDGADMTEAEVDDALSAEGETKTIGMQATPMRVGDLAFGDMISVPDGRGGHIVGTVTNLDDTGSAHRALRVVDANGAGRLITLGNDAAVSRLTARDGQLYDLPDFDSMPVQRSVEDLRLRGMAEGQFVRVRDRKTGEIVAAGRTVHPKVYRSNYSGDEVPMLQTPDGRVLELRSFTRSRREADGVYVTPDVEFEVPLSPEVYDPTPVPLDADGYADLGTKGLTTSQAKPGDEVLVPVRGRGGDGSTHVFMRATVTTVERPDRKADVSDRGVVVNYRLADGREGYQTSYDDAETLEMIRVRRGGPGAAAREKARADLRTERSNRAKAVARSLSVGLDKAVVGKLRDDADPALLGPNLRALADGIDGKTLDDTTPTLGAVAINAETADGRTFTINFIPHGLAAMLRGGDEIEGYRADIPAPGTPERGSTERATTMQTGYMADLLRRAADTVDFSEAAHRQRYADVEDPVQRDELIYKAMAADMSAVIGGDPQRDLFADRIAAAYDSARGGDSIAELSLAKGEFNQVAARAGFETDLESIGRQFRFDALKRAVDMHRSRGVMPRGLDANPAVSKEDSAALRLKIDAAMRVRFGDAAVEAMPPADRNDLARKFEIQVRKEIDFASERGPSGVRELRDMVYNASGVAELRKSKIKPLDTDEGTPAIIGALSARARAGDYAPASDHLAGISELRARIGETFGERTDRRVELTGTMADLLNGDYDMTTVNRRTADIDDNDGQSGSIMREHLAVVREAGRRVQARVDAVATARREANGLAAAERTNEALGEKTDAMTRMRGELYSQVDEEIGVALRLAYGRPSEDGDQEVAARAGLSGSGAPASDDASEYYSQLYSRAKIRGLIVNPNAGVRTRGKKAYPEAVRKVIDDLAAAHATQTKELGAAIKEVERLAAENNDLWDKLDASVIGPSATAGGKNDFVAALSEIREMGRPSELDLDTLFDFGDLGGHDVATIRTRMEEALSFYPADWIRTYHEAVASGRLGKLEIFRDLDVNARDRAYYQGGLRRLNVGSGSLDSLVHELGHQMETVVPGLNTAEFAILSDRITTGNVGSRRRQAQKVIIKGQNKGETDESAYPDRFGNAYTGKTYSSGHQPGGDEMFGVSYYEVFTTAIQSVAQNGSLLPDGNSGSYRMLDNDLREWLLGVMATVGGRPGDGTPHAPLADRGERGGAVDAPRVGAPPATLPESQAPRDLPRMDPAEYRAYTEQLQTRLDAAIAQGLETDVLHGRRERDEQGRVVDITWNDDRAAVHDEIVEDMFNRHFGDVPSEGRALFSGGLGGAGKGTVLRGLSGQLSAQYGTIDPDEFKEELAKRGMVPEVEGVSPMEAATLIHEESSHLAKMLTARVLAERKNVILDTTMANLKINKKIDELEAAGYGAPEAVFIDVPVETSVRRALGRHEAGAVRYQAGYGYGGRFVPPGVIRSNAPDGDEYNSRNRETFEQVKDRFGRWWVYDNSRDGQSPILLSDFEGNGFGTVEAGVAAGAGQAGGPSNPGAGQRATETVG